MYILQELEEQVIFFFFFQAEDGIRDKLVTGVQTCALPISLEEGGEVGDRVILREPRPQIGRDLVGRLARQILDGMEHLGVPRSLPPQLSHEDRGVRLQSAETVQVTVDVDGRELDRPAEARVMTV